METEREPSKVQTLSDGSGATFHRIYAVDLPCSTEDAYAAMARFQADPNEFSPQVLAKFEKTRGAEGRMAVGDEYLIRISGPWDGPVRVTKVTPAYFTFATLKGHLEAGKIQFRVAERESGIRFEIESVARSKDSLVDFLYDKIPVARFAQTKMWEMVCEAFFSDATGIERDREDEDDKLCEIEITTERHGEEESYWVKF